MTDLVAIQAEVLADLRAATGRPVWPCDTLADLGLACEGTTGETSVGELIGASS